ncbi:MAG: hypothetical protein R6X32_23725 [Chloroflexota bacterium]
MFWFKLSKYRRLWRLVFLPLLFVAINGPWFFDLMWAPAPYTCLPPNIRLDETFCGGATQSIGPFFLSILSEVITMLGNWMAGIFNISPLLFFFFLLSLVLPLGSALILIVRQEQGRWQQAHICLLALAAGATLLLMVSSITHQRPALWGIWLYLITTVTWLILETFTRHRTSEPAL